MNSKLTKNSTAREFTAVGDRTASACFKMQDSLLKAAMRNCGNSKTSRNWKLCVYTGRLISMQHINHTWFHCRNHSTQNFVHVHSSRLLGLST